MIGEGKISELIEVGADETLMQDNNEFMTRDPLVDGAAAASLDVAENDQLVLEEPEMKVKITGTLLKQIQEIRSSTEYLEQCAYFIDLKSKTCLQS